VELVMTTLHPLPRTTAPPLTPLLLQGALEHGLALMQAHILSVHLQHDISGAAQDLGNLAQHEPDDEGDRQYVEDVFRARAHAAHHGESTPAGLKGHKSKSHNAETQATGGRFRLTAAPAEHYLRPIPPTTYSVAHPSEIKKLEQRYRENPKGRNFAPLADAYRKAGLLD